MNNKKVKSKQIHEFPFVRNFSFKQKIFQSHFFIKSTKGNIPITILVIGIVVVCVLALFTFFTSGSNVKESFTSLSIVEKTNTFFETMKFYENLGKNPEQEMEIFQKNWFKGDSLQNITFRVEGGFIEGTFMRDNQRIIWIKKRID